MKLYIDESIEMDKPYIRSEPEFFHAESPDSTTEEDESNSEKSCFCRICHEVGKRETFIAPCLCKGSLKLVHKDCLEIWLARSCRAQCELCGFHYKTRRIPKYTIMSSVFAWLSSPASRQDRRMLISDLISIMVMIPVACLFTMQGFRAANKVLLPQVTNKIGEAVLTGVLQMIVFSGVLLCDLGILAWTAMRVHSNFHAWFSWYRKNCIVILIDYEEISNDPIQSLTRHPSVHQE